MVKILVCLVPPRPPNPARPRKAGRFSLCHQTLFPLRRSPVHTPDAAETPAEYLPVSAGSSPRSRSPPAAHLPPARQRTHRQSSTSRNRPFTRRLCPSFSTSKSCCSGWTTRITSSRVSVISSSSALTSPFNWRLCASKCHRFTISRITIQPVPTRSQNEISLAAPLPLPSQGERAGARGPSHPRREVPSTGVSFAPSAACTCAGTNVLTSPPNRAISFTIRELRKV